MLEIEIETEIIGTEAEDSLFDPYEVNWLIEDTRQRLQQEVGQKLAEVICAEHQVAPQIRLKIVYDAATEQFDVQYHIETCCPLFRVQVVKTLNQT